MKPALPLFIIFLVSASAFAQLPPPASNKVYSLGEVLKSKFDLDGKVVRLQVNMSSLAPEQVSATEYRVFAQSDDKSGFEMNHVYIPKPGFDSLGLNRKNPSKNFMVWAIVTPDKITAVGKTINRDMGGRVNYVW